MCVYDNQYCLHIQEAKLVVPTLCDKYSGFHECKRTRRDSVLDTFTVHCHSKVNMYPNSATAVACDRFYFPVTDAVHVSKSCRMKIPYSFSTALHYNITPKPQFWTNRIHSVSRVCECRPNIMPPKLCPAGKFWHILNIDFISFLNLTPLSLLAVDNRRGIDDMGYAVTCTLSMKFIGWQIRTVRLAKWYDPESEVTDFYRFSDLIPIISVKIPSLSHKYWSFPYFQKTRP